VHLANNKPHHVWAVWQNKVLKSIENKVKGMNPLSQLDHFGLILLLLNQDFAGWIF